MRVAIRLHAGRQQSNIQFVLDVAARNFRDHIHHHHPHHNRHRHRHYPHPHLHHQHHRHRHHRYHRHHHHHTHHHHNHQHHHHHHHTGASQSKPEPARTIQTNQNMPNQARLHPKLSLELILDPLGCFLSTQDTRGVWGREGCPDTSCPP